MGYLKYMKAAWKKPSKTISELMKKRLMEWRKEPSTVRIRRPTRIDRARSLGYKAKPGFVVVRQKVGRGGHNRPRVGRRGRRPKAQRRFMILSKSYQTIAEQRANKKFLNCEVLASYPVGMDGKNKWFEVILVDKKHPQIKADTRTRWISKKQHTKRVERGLTPSAKKTRGLRRKGKGAEKIRPSQRAKKRLAK